MNTLDIELMKIHKNREFRQDQMGQDKSKRDTVLELKNFPESLRRTHQEHARVGFSWWCEAASLGRCGDRAISQGTLEVTKPCDA